MEEKLRQAREKEAEARQCQICLDHDWGVAFGTTHITPAFVSKVLIIIDHGALAYFFYFILRFHARLRSPSLSGVCRGAEPVPHLPTVHRFKNSPILLALNFIDITRPLRFGTHTNSRFGLSEYQFEINRGYPPDHF
jgi:hypothetical protein